MTHQYWQNDKIDIWMSIKKKHGYLSSSIFLSQMVTIWILCMSIHQNVSVLTKAHRISELYWTPSVHKCNTTICYKYILKDMSTYVAWWDLFSYFAKVIHRLFWKRRKIAKCQLINIFENIHLLSRFYLSNIAILE